MDLSNMKYFFEYMDIPYIDGLEDKNIRLSHLCEDTMLCLALYYSCNFRGSTMIMCEYPDYINMKFLQMCMKLPRWYTEYNAEKKREIIIYNTGDSRVRFVHMNHNMRGYSANFLFVFGEPSSQCIDYIIPTIDTNNQHKIAIVYQADKKFMSGLTRIHTHPLHNGIFIKVDASDMQKLRDMGYNIMDDRIYMDYYKLPYNTRNILCSFPDNIKNRIGDLLGKELEYVSYY